jgi:hypothetical protein
LPPDEISPLKLTTPNNIVYRNGLGDNREAILAGEFCTFACTNQEVYNNTIYQNNGTCVRLSRIIDTKAPQNNICYQNGTDNVTQASTQNSVVDYNLLGIDPLFVNAAAKDFHLGTGSPAIGAGVVMPGLSYNGSAPALRALQSGINRTASCAIKVQICRELVVLQRSAWAHAP